LEAHFYSGGAPQDRIKGAQREISVEDRQEEEKAEALKRIPGLWETACKRCEREDLVWRPSHVKQFADQFLEIALSRNVRNMPDQELLDRLTLLCGNPQCVEMEMSEAFSSHNKSGLTAQSLAMYGDKLLVLAGAKLECEKKVKEDAAKQVDQQLFAQGETPCPSSFMR
jgi:hypothetical protein